MKLSIILILSFICQNIFSQIEKVKTYDYKTHSGKVFVVEIDTTKYKPDGYKDFLYRLYNKEIDASIAINEKKINLNDTIKQFENAKKDGEFTDLGKVNGEKIITVKILHTIKNKSYVYFSYMKIIPPNELINFTFSIPENDFEVYKSEFINYAKSMKPKE